MCVFWLSIGFGLFLEKNGPIGILFHSSSLPLEKGNSLK